MAKKKKTDIEKAKKLKKLGEQGKKTPIKKKEQQEHKSKAKKGKDVTPKGKKSGTKTGTMKTPSKTTPAKKTPPSSSKKKKQNRKEMTRAELLKITLQKAKGKAKKSGFNVGKKRKQKADSDSEDQDDDRDNGRRARGSSHENEKLNKWKPEQMEIAVYAVLEDRKLPLRERIGIRTIARTCGVPRNTLNQRVLGRVSGFGHMSGGENQPKCFTKELEEELVECILAHADAGFPFIPKQVRNTAFEFAQMNGLREFSKDDELSRNWLRLFLKRNPKINTSFCFIKIKQAENSAFCKCMPPNFQTALRNVLQAFVSRFFFSKSKIQLSLVR